MSLSACAKAIKTPGSVNVMGGLPVKYVIAAGASQSAIYLARYYNGIQAHSRGGVFNGFFILISGGSLRTNLTVPVFNIYSETEVPTLTRQADSKVYRAWEVAGASHVDYDTEMYGAPVRDRDGIPVTSFSCDKQQPMSRLHFAHAQNAAYDHLVKWIASGTLPPTAPKITTTGSLIKTITRDSYGNALGGLRLSQMVVPTAVNTGSNSGPDFCILMGQYVPFTAAQLKSLYPTHDNYVTKVTNAVNANLSSGYIVKADADITIAEAKAANIPPDGGSSTSSSSSSSSTSSTGWWSSSSSSSSSSSTGSWWLR